MLNLMQKVLFITIILFVQQGETQGNNFLAAPTNADNSRPMWPALSLNLAYSTFLNGSNTLSENMKGVICGGVLTEKGMTM